MDLALRVNDSIAAINLMDLRLRALKEGIDLDESKSQRPVIALFFGWDNDLMRCEVFKKLMQDTNHATLLKSMRRDIVRCVCHGGHVRLLEEVIRLLGVKARDLDTLTPGCDGKLLCWFRSPPLWIAADNGNVDQVGSMFSAAS